MRKETRYSLTRLINSVVSGGAPSGYEMDRSAEFERSLPKRLRERQTGIFVPSSAFGREIATRDLTTGTGAASFIGQKVKQLPGVVGWSAAIRSGCVLIGPLESDKLSIFHDSNLPAASWQPETGLVSPADIQFAATIVSPHRVAAQCLVSRQLVAQYGGSPALDEFVASRLKIALSSALDQAVLYGAGAPNAPTGILTVAGAQSVTVSAPPAWSDLVKMRFQSTNFDVDRSSFGFITSPNVRRRLEETAKFAGGAITNWDSIGPETEISREVSDDRIFSGVWAFAAIAFWGPAGSEDITVDILVDPFSRAERGEIILTGGFYCDVAIRFPQLFCFSQASVAGP